MDEANQTSPLPDEIDNLDLVPGGPELSVGNDREHDPSAARAQTPFPDARQASTDISDESDVSPVLTESKATIIDRRVLIGLIVPPYLAIILDIYLNPTYSVDHIIGILSLLVPLTFMVKRIVNYYFPRSPKK
jgi:hypothetical protein